MKPINYELDLLQEVSQVNPSLYEISLILSNHLNYDLLLNLAVANGVLPLLVKQLPENDPNYQEIFKSHAVSKKNSFFMIASLQQLNSQLKKYNIPFIPIKGPVLGANAYENALLRPFSDLDILVRQKDLIAVSKILTDLGYINEEKLEILSHQFILKRFSDISYKHPDTGIVIELHWKLLKNTTRELSDINHLFSNSTSITLKNVVFRSLPLEEEFIYLCIHASKHRWERIEWMNDINFLVQKNRNIYKWSKILHIAKMENHLSSYLLAILLLEKNYHQKIPDESTLTLINKKVYRLYDLVMQRHRSNSILLPKKDGIRIHDIAFAFHLEDTFKRKLSILFSILFPLYKSDILDAPMFNRKLQFLYYFFRIKRIFSTHFFKW